MLFETRAYCSRQSGLFPPLAHVTWEGSLCLFGLWQNTFTCTVKKKKKKEKKNAVLRPFRNTISLLKINGVRAIVLGCKKNRAWMDTRVEAASRKPKHSLQLDFFFGSGELKEISISLSCADFEVVSYDRGVRAAVVDQVLAFAYFTWLWFKSGLVDRRKDRCQELGGWTLVKGTHTQAQRDLRKRGKVSHHLLISPLLYPADRRTVLW